MHPQSTQHVNNNMPKSTSNSKSYVEDIHHTGLVARRIRSIELSTASETSAINEGQDSPVHEEKSTEQEMPPSSSTRVAAPENVSRGNEELENLVKLNNHMGLILYKEQRTVKNQLLSSTKSEQANSEEPRDEIESKSINDNDLQDFLCSDTVEEIVRRGLSDFVNEDEASWETNQNIKTSQLHGSRRNNGRDSPHNVEGEATQDKETAETTSKQAPLPLLLLPQQGRNHAPPKIIQDLLTEIDQVDKIDFGKAWKILGGPASVSDRGGDGSTFDDSGLGNSTDRSSKGSAYTIIETARPRRIYLSPTDAKNLPVQKDQRDSDMPVPPVAEVTFPEGGFRAWLVVFGCWCGMFASLGLASTLAAFQTFWLEDTLSDYTPSQLGWIFSTYAFLTFGCGVYIGPFFDYYGPRWMVFTGSGLLAIMMFCLPYCTEYGSIFFVFGIVGGVGSSLLFTPCIAAPSHYFSKGRGLATGIASAGGACGGIAFPLLMQSLNPTLGFAWTTRIMEAIMVVFLVIANILIRSRLPRSTKFPKPRPDFRVFRSPAFSMTVAGVFLLELGIFIPLTYITSYARHNGYETNFAYQILPIINVGSAFGRPIPGFLSDRIGHYNTIILFTIVTILSIMACWLPFGHQTPAIVIFALLFGFSSGCNISLTPVCIGQLCDTRDYGRYYATCYTVVSIGCLVGIPIAGQILENSGFEYWSLIVWTGCCYAYALIAFVVARGLGGGWKFSTVY